LSQNPPKETQFSRNSLLGHLKYVAKYLSIKSVSPLTVVTLCNLSFYHGTCTNAIYQKNEGFFCYIFCIKHFLDANCQCLIFFILSIATVLNFWLKSESFRTYETNNFNVLFSYRFWESEISLFWKFGTKFETKYETSLKTGQF